MAYTTVNELFTAIADAIRNKTGKTDKIASQDMPAEIEAIETGSGISFTLTDLKYMFTSQARIDQFPIFLPAALNPTNLNHAFSDCSSLGAYFSWTMYAEQKQAFLDWIENVDYSNVTDLAYGFSTCNVSGYTITFDTLTSKCTAINNAFASFTGNIIITNNCDLSSIESAYMLFNNANGNFEIYPSNFAPTRIDYMFYNTKGTIDFKNAYIEFNPSSETYSRSVFYGCKATINNFNWSGFKLSKSFYNMFYNCTAFDTIDLQACDFSTLVASQTTNALYGCTASSVLNIPSFGMKTGTFTFSTAANTSITNMTFQDNFQWYSNSATAATTFDMTKFTALTTASVANLFTQAATNETNYTHVLKLPTSVFNAVSSEYPNEMTAFMNKGYNISYA